MGKGPGSGCLGKGLEAGSGGQASCDCRGAWGRCRIPWLFLAVRPGWVWGSCPAPSAETRTFFKILYKFYLFIYFWLHWVFVAVHGLSLVVASGGYSSLRCMGFLLRWLLLLQSMGSRLTGSSSCGLRALERRLSSCGMRASVVVARGLWSAGSIVVVHGLSSCGSRAVERRLSSCGAWA